MLKKRQSPVNLVSPSTRYDDHLAKGKVVFSYIDSDVTSILNDGHCWKLKLKNDSKSTVKFSHLQDDYRLDSIHCHWGPADLGSEHRIGNLQHAAELHFVNYDSRFGSMANALESKDDKYAIAAIGIFLEMSEQDNNHLNDLVSKIANIHHKGQSVKLDGGFGISKLIPADQSRWIYDGSLSTHPYTENVAWTIFRTPVSISKAQLASFRTLSSSSAGDSEKKMINSNCRDAQPLYDRIVFSSFH